MNDSQLGQRSHNVQCGPSPCIVKLPRHSEPILKKQCVDITYKRGLVLTKTKVASFISSHC